VNEPNFLALIGSRSLELIHSVSKGRQNSCQIIVPIYTPNKLINPDILDAQLLKYPLHGIDLILPEGLIIMHPIDLKQLGPVVNVIILPDLLYRVFIGQFLLLLLQVRLVLLYLEVLFPFKPLQLQFVLLLVVGGLLVGSL